MSGCIEWTGPRLKSGYGRVWSQGKMKRAHRVAYEDEYGPIPEGMSVLHTCDNPPCVRPEHLFIGTQLDNIRDMDRKGRRVNGPSFNAKKTHCPRGHPYDEENTYIQKSGSRHCKECTRASVRRWNKEKFGIGRGA